ncbi:MAG: hypothetical protein RLZZ628_3728 [Bacteroidota bacterium]|jgi:hypothetical protein
MKAKVFLFLQWCFFGKIPKKIICPQPKPKAKTTDELQKERWQFQPQESSESSLSWKSSDHVTKPHPSECINNEDESIDKSCQHHPVKHSVLTSDDEKELIKRGLDIGKAITIKPYWFSDISRFNAAQTIGIKGFSESIIGKYYAAFNAVHDAQYIENQ